MSRNDFIFLKMYVTAPIFVTCDNYCHPDFAKTFRVFYFKMLLSHYYIILQICQYTVFVTYLVSR